MDFIGDNKNLDNSTDYEFISEELCTKLFHSIINIRYEQNERTKSGTGFFMKLIILF